MLKLEAIRGEETIPLGTLDKEQIYIGREPDEGIAVDHSAISRTHGLFQNIRHHWFYKDLGSTNGSWINGKVCPKEQWRLVRPGTVIQLADVALRLSSDTPEQVSAQSVRSLIVFADGEFADEFPVPEYGRALVLGGSQPDLPISGDVHELPALVIERRGADVSAYRPSEQYPLTVNGEPRQESVVLEDGDALDLANYLVLYHDPLSGAGREHQDVDDSGWETPPASPKERGAGRSLFGQQLDNPSDLEETVTMTPEEMEAHLAGFDVPPSRRVAVHEPGDSPLGSFEDKAILFIGILLALALAGIVVWWMLL